MRCLAFAVLLALGLLASSPAAYGQKCDVKAEGGSVGICGEVKDSKIVIGVPQEKIDELVRERTKPLEDLTASHDRVEPREQPRPWARHPPPIAQQLQQLRREHDKAILLPFALLDAQQHALVIDVGDLQRDDLGHTQTGAIGHAERRLVFDAGGGRQKSCDFLRAQHGRRPARLAH